MCLAVPGKLIKKEGNRGIVEIGGLQVSVFMQLLPDSKPGHYVLVHAGCALEIIEEEEAFKTLQLLKELGENEICR